MPTALAEGAVWGCLDVLARLSKVQTAIVVTLKLAWAWAVTSHFKVYVKVFYVMGKALLGELSCTGQAFSHSPLNFLSSFFLSLGDGPI